MERFVEKVREYQAAGKIMGQPDPAKGYYYDPKKPSLPTIPYHPFPPSLADTTTTRRSLRTPRSAQTCTR